MEHEFNLEDIMANATNTSDYDFQTPRSNRASKHVEVSDELISFEENEGYDD